MKPILHNFCPHCGSQFVANNGSSSSNTNSSDQGGNPFVVNIEKTAEKNDTFRTAIWTGEHLQVTVMSIAVGEDVGLELHADLDQFLRIEEGKGFVQMGNSEDNLTFEREVEEDFAIVVPAGV